MKLKLKVTIIVIALTVTLISLGLLVSSLRQAAPLSFGDGNREQKLNFTKPVIVIDPGHGGEDMGTVKNGLAESWITLDIARRLYSLLNTGSYTIHMTRTGDNSLDKLSEVDGTFEQKDLDARAKYIKGCSADFFVSIHVDSFPEAPSASGSVAYYSTSGCPGSLELAECIQESLNTFVGRPLTRPDYTARKGDFFLLRNSDIPCALVEIAFISNRTDRELLKRDDFKNNLAEAIAKGIENWLDKQHNEIS